MMLLEKSLLTQFLEPEASPKRIAGLIDHEVRWHYSQHLAAECKGEEIIEDMLSLANDKRKRALLNAQLQDEKRHVDLFQAEVDRIGYDDRATTYANGYSDLVLSLNSLAEKAFVFQILTESISAAYCAWRLTAITDRALNALDHEVELDERRHLLMGKTLMTICDPDEVASCLTSTKKKSLIRKMNNICIQANRKDFSYSILGDLGILAVELGPTELDSLIARAVISEARNLDSVKKI